MAEFPSSPGIGVPRKWPGPFFRSAGLVPSTTTQSTSIFGILMKAMPLPPSSGAVTGATGTVEVVTTTELSGSVLSGLSVVAESMVVVPSSTWRNSSRRSLCSRAVWMPVPHS